METTAVPACGRPKGFRGSGMPTLTTVVVHETRTGRSNHSYQFTPKHHGADVTAAQWLPSISLEEEFAIFDEADERDISDKDGNLYGVQQDAEGGLRCVGMWNEQVAEYPVA